MADDTGRCVNCGFLGKRRTVVDAESIVYAATSYDRQKGTFNRESGWPDQRDMPTQPTCFRNAANLQRELVEELAIDGKHGTDWENACTCIIIAKPRECESWYAWTEYHSPKEHYEEFKEELNRQERKRTNRIMIWLTIALIVFAALQVYAALASINPEHWLFNWLR